jgi:tetratricopeptide (TPR) repeat protein
VSHASFSPDGRRVVTASGDRTARVWDAETGQPLSAPLRHEGGVSHASFSPDGRRVLTACDDNLTRVWLAPMSDDRASDDWIQLAEMLDGARIDQGGNLVPITPQEFRDAWRTLREKYPDNFVASPADVLAWHRNEGYDCELHGHWDTALTHLEYLIAVQPLDGWLLARRGRIYAHLGRWKDSVSDLTRAVERLPLEARIRIDRGDAFAELGRWDEAAVDFRKAVEDQARDPGRETRSRLAHVSLARNDIVTYRRMCEGILNDIGQSGHSRCSPRVVWTLALAPNALGDRNAVGWLAEHVAKEPEDEGDQHRSLSTLAAVNYRANRLDEALRHLQADIKDHARGGNALDWLLLALVHQRLIHADEARTWLEKATDWIDRSTREKPADEAFGARVDWQTWLALRLLRREAESALLAVRANP